MKADTLPRKRSTGWPVHEWRPEELEPVVFARAGMHPLQPNSGIIVGNAGVLVVDCGYSTAAGRDLLVDVRMVTPLPVTRVVISHHHVDHAWGSRPSRTRCWSATRMPSGRWPPSRRRIARMIASAPTSAGWYGVRPEELALPFAETRITPPSVTFAGRMDGDLPGQQVELRYLGAGHTDGDTLVSLPQARILGVAPSPPTPLPPERARGA